MPKYYEDIKITTNKASNVSDMKFSEEDIKKLLKICKITKGPIIGQYTDQYGKVSIFETTNFMLDDVGDIICSAESTDDIPFDDILLFPLFDVDKTKENTDPDRVYLKAMCWHLKSPI